MDRKLKMSRYQSEGKIECKGINFFYFLLDQTTDTIAGNYHVNFCHSIKKTPVNFIASTHPILV